LKSKDGDEVSGFVCTKHDCSGLSGECLCCKSDAERDELGWARNITEEEQLQAGIIVLKDRAEKAEAIVTAVQDWFDKHLVDGDGWYNSILPEQAGDLHSILKGNCSKEWP